MSFRIRRRHPPGLSPHGRRRRVVPACERCEARRLLVSYGTLAIHNATTTEGETATVEVTLMLTSPPENAVTVDFSTIDGTAKAGTDYQATSGTLIFAPDQTEQQIHIPIKDDLAFENPESFFVKISNPQFADLAPGQDLATVVILDNDQKPVLSIADASAPESAGSISFPVTLAGATDVPATVPFTTVDGTAVAGRDYTRTSGVLTFAPGQMIQYVTVPLIDNPVVNPNRTFTVQLGTPIGATLGRAVATGTILNDDLGGSIAFASPTAVVDEDAGSVALTVTRTGGLAGGVTVDYVTTDGSAVAGADYQPTAGTLSFGPGETSKTITIPILPDFLIEGDETFSVLLGNPTGGATLGSPSRATVVIRNTSSTVVTNTRDSGPGSLRWALLTADANPGLDTVRFAIPGAGPFTIAPASPLPEIIDPSVIDGTTQPGYAGAPVVVLDGIAAGPSTYGLALLAGGTTVRGLAIVRFSASGLAIVGPGGNRVEGNTIGTDALGSLGLGNAFDGVTIYQSAGNVIGGSAPGAGNVASGNGLVGIRIEGADSTGSVVQGNKIGTDASGSRRLPNAFGGAFLDNVAGNLIGGSAPGAGNVISGNDGAGLQLLGPGATANAVQGNRIGTDLSGTAPVPNRFDGLFLNAAPGNLIGGVVPGAGNVISGNLYTGVRLAEAGATGNLLLGNRIGTDITGTRAVGNLTDGVFILNAPGNVVGGLAPGSANVISGNGSVGIQIFGPAAAHNSVFGNLIGTDLTGLAALGNLRDGVFVNQAPQNVIGGALPGAGNLISANGSVGVQLFGPGSVGNVVQGNKIGTDALGAARLGNRFGLFVNEAVGSVIGAPPPEAANLIAGNLVQDTVGIAAPRTTTAAPVGPTVPTGPRGLASSPRIRPASLAARPRRGRPRGR